ncbi:MAG: GNAT family N-acetyltransferase [Clostridia bacterium]|nr:GNAT family N-acetyltransferase [Clostridia bacterium]
MEVRQLVTPEEHRAASLIAAVAFHSDIEDTLKWGVGSPDWGAFAEDGALMARVVNNQFDVYFDGHVVKSGGIGGVCTLPEYRYQGAVAAILAKLLPQAYESGEVVSSLFPFNHAFYRKAGYETVCWRGSYALPPAVLRPCRFAGRAVLWKPGDSVAPHLALYNRFAAGYNLALRRDEARMADHVRGEYYKDHKFCYLLEEDGRPVAYVIFQDVRHDPAAILSVQDMAWDGPAGFHAILGFLSRFSADYGEIRLFLPNCLELFSLIRTDDAYLIKKTVDQGYMARVVNAEKLLSLMKKPEGCRFVIRISDGIIARNNGTFAVCGEAVTPTEEAPDLIVSVQALAQLALGGVSLGEALYRPDVQVLGHEALLETIFTRKPILVLDHY